MFAASFLRVASSLLNSQTVAGDTAKDARTRFSHQANKGQHPRCRGAVMSVAQRRGCCPARFLACTASLSGWIAEELVAVSPQATSRVTSFLSSLIPVTLRRQSLQNVSSTRVKRRPANERATQWRVSGLVP